MRQLIRQPPRRSLWVFALTLALLALSSAPAQARNKKPKTAPKEPQDSIQVVGHIAVVGGPVTGFFTTQHYSSYYLYAEHGSAKAVTLIDVTRVAHPAVLTNVLYPSHDGSSSLFAVTGTAALVTEGLGQATSPALHGTVEIMDFSDPQQPKVARVFNGVTAIHRDQERGLIFLANNDGIWILHQNLAEDPAVEEEYTRQVLYDH